MGVETEGKSFHCPCCKAYEDYGEFQEVGNLINTGLVIYRHRKHEEGINKKANLTASETDTSKDVFILHNTRESKITSATFLTDFEQNVITCQRCRKIMKHAQDLLQNIPIIEKNHTIGICDHCHMMSAGPCEECEKIVKKFLASKYEQKEYKERVQKWLEGVQHLIKDVITKEKQEKHKKSRILSDVHIDKLYQGTIKTTRAMEMGQMFSYETYPSGSTGDISILKSLDQDRLGKKEAHYVSKRDLSDITAEFKDESLVTTNESKKQKSVTIGGSTSSQQYYSTNSNKQNKDRLDFPETEEMKKISNHIINIKEGSYSFSKSSKASRYGKVGIHLPQGATGAGKPTLLLKKKSQIQSLEEHLLPFKKDIKLMNLEDFKEDLNDKEKRKLIPYEKEKEIKKYKHFDITCQRKYSSEGNLLTAISTDIKDIMTKEFSYYFPHEVKEDVPLTRRKSSSELFKETHEMLQVREEEKKKQKEEELKKKLEDEIRKKMEREEKKRIAKERKEKLEKERIADQKKQLEAEVIARQKVIEKADAFEKGGLSKSKKSEAIDGTSPLNRESISDNKIKKTQDENVKKDKYNKNKEEYENLNKQKGETKQRGEAQKDNNLLEGRKKEFTEKEQNNQEKAKKKDDKDILEKEGKSREEQRDKYKKGEGKLDNNYQKDEQGKSKLEKEKKEVRERTQKERNQAEEDKNRMKRENKEKEEQKKQEIKKERGRQDKEGQKQQQEISFQDDKNMTDNEKKEKERNQQREKAEKEDYNEKKEKERNQQRGKAEKEDYNMQNVQQKKDKDDDQNKIKKKGDDTTKNDEDKKGKENIQKRHKEKDDKMADEALKRLVTQQNLEKEKVSKEKHQQEENEKKAREAAEKKTQQEPESKQKVQKEAKTDKKTQQKPEKPQKSAEESIPPKELDMKDVKIKNPSYDDLLFQLVKSKNSEQTRERTKPPQIADIDPVIIKTHKTLHKKKRAAGCDICEYSDLEIEIDNISYKDKQGKIQEMADIIIGEKIFKYKLPHVEKYEKEEISPILFKSFHQDEISSHTKDLSKEYKSIPTTTPQSKKLHKPEQEVAKGVIHYALSDRSFIDKGWTMLPTEKVVRKMNVYRMRPAHPEFDWFAHNKHKRIMEYDTGEKLAEFDDDGRGRWFYRNGRLALNYYDAEELNAQQRFVIYSNGKSDERGRSRPITVLAMFDYLGNGVVFDHKGKIRLKYNQTEGVVLDRALGPVSHWKWHTLNDPPVLQQVMIDTQMARKDPEILKLGGPKDDKARPENEEMLAIEFDNFIKEKSKKLSQKFKPFQIKMKALKVNENFSLRVLDQATIYLMFKDGSTNLKMNIGMRLDHQEIIDTDTAEVGEVSNNLERFPARTDSLAALQHSVACAQSIEKARLDHEKRLQPAKPRASVDQLTAAASRPLRPPFRTLPTDSTVTSNQYYCKCRIPPNNLYYDTRLF